MKKVLMIFLLILLTGCSNTKNDFQKAIESYQIDETTGYYYQYQITENNKITFEDTHEVRFDFEKELVSSLLSTSFLETNGLDYDITSGFKFFNKGRVGIDLPATGNISWSDGNIYDVIENLIPIKKLDMKHIKSYEVSESYNSYTFNEYTFKGVVSEPNKLFQTDYNVIEMTIEIMLNNNKDLKKIIIEFKTEDNQKHTHHFHVFWDSTSIGVPGE